MQVRCRSNQTQDGVTDETDEGKDQTQDVVINVAGENELQAQDGMTMEDLRLTDSYHAIRLLNYKTENFHDSLRKCRENFIVIDNADILLDDEDRRFINFEISNQYMIFSRNCDGLNLSEDSFMVLNEKDCQVTLRRE